jgi:PIN domain nuclease of toxin-antitoxin system
MGLLLDTHTLLWYAFGDSRLSGKARALIDDSANEKFLSIASPWEVGIKVSSGKLTVAKPVDVFFADQIRLLSLHLLPITLAHVARAATLPFHHRDPFDRMLIAQSLTEGIPLVSADPALDAYGVTRLW